MTYDQELLTVLSEECAEVIQAASKIIRFGADSEYDGVTALDALEKELGDLYCMIDLLHANDMISFTKLDDYSNEKYEKLKKWSNLIE
jgi:NTP pyrophosphatase (non-canonical NTP hydrolase)